MSYTIGVERTATKSLKKIPQPLLERIENAISQLAENPEKGKSLRGELDGFLGLRVGGFRVIYEVNSVNKSVRILLIEPRGKVYKRRGRR